MRFLCVGERFRPTLQKWTRAARGQILEPQHCTALRNEGRDRTL
jgi:hypothetical protein